MKGGMRSEAITDQSDIKTGVVAEAPPGEEEANWEMKIRRAKRGSRQKKSVNM